MNRTRRMGGVAGQTMTRSEFRQIAGIITSELGIRLPDSKKGMLQARLQKRLRALGLTTYTAYCEYIGTPASLERERPYLYDVITTNTTYFFREPKHFTLLGQEVLPDLLMQQGGTRLRVWSAGCSTGEEPYTLAMLLMDYSEQVQGFDFGVLATDISTSVLRTAIKAVYPADKAEGIPRRLLMRFFMRSKDRSQKQLKIVPELRKKVEFRRLNFMDNFAFKQPMDIVFCRNVIIYFDRVTQERLLARICEQIRPGGYLFSGHSESVSSMRLPLRTVAPTVYRRV